VGEGRVQVTVYDPETGEVETEYLSPRSYILTLGERMEVAHEQQYANGTVQMTLRLKRDDGS
jgi:hypothetical protein